jgi:hypothetical protein
MLALRAGLHCNLSKILFFEMWGKNFVSIDYSRDGFYKKAKATLYKGLLSRN